MKNRAILLTMAGALALTACGEDPNGAGDPDLEKATTDGEAQALSRAIEAGDFASLKLGAKIVGPQGPEVKSAFGNASGNFADVRSYVTCPGETATCDPAKMPDGTVYTYVFVVIPGEDNDDDTGSGKGPDNAKVEKASAFLMTQPAHGFTGKAGYSKAEAIAAMGKDADVVITCDRGKLVWTLNSGDGGDQWQSGEPVTFYWQSTLPPAGPASAYEIRADYSAGQGKGPYPAASEKATNACA